jgi:LAO/AO transport system kinase
VADLVVVNKGDKPGAQRTAAQLRAMLVPSVGRGGPDERADRPTPKRPEVLLTTASTGAGVPELLTALDRHRAAGRASASNEARRNRARAQVQAVLAGRLADRLRTPGLAERTEQIIDEVAAHRLDPFAAADALLEAALSTHATEGS